jgi:hypothetical protein
MRGFRNWGLIKEVGQAKGRSGGCRRLSRGCRKKKMEELERFSDHFHNFLQAQFL